MNNNKCINQDFYGQREIGLLPYTVHEKCSDTDHLAGQTVACEKIEQLFWSLGKLTTCFMQSTTTIDTADVQISTSRNDRVEVLSFFSNDKIELLPVEPARNFPRLIIYAANRCSIKYIKRENFENLNMLREIYLHDNRIKRVDNNVFKGLNSLQHIDLSKS